ncbi:hypothetical protein Ccrd_022261 [Cynara cardunculus var. scolymus]|uniref:Uncharacterized protein n=1 Tax=Cynara cardunculus var. scolymus TaxID=59895 RepID=A0A118JZG0_CYNCS|nr:hypothetical protein Ccrd_022261 [Cynara cardunculus var. scolymus]
MSSIPEGIDAQISSIVKKGPLVSKDIIDQSARVEPRLLLCTDEEASSDCKVSAKSDEEPYLWQSFSFPTDTILPDQPFTKDTVLISFRSSTNLSSGFYKLYFDNDNVICLLYNSEEITSVYRPSPW